MRLFSSLAIGLTSCFLLNLSIAQSVEGNRPESPQRPQLPKGMQAIEPAALDLLLAMSKKLASAKTIQFQALGHSEFPSIDGIPVIYSTAAKIALQRPNKFNVVVSGDGPSSSSTTISGQLGVA